MIRLVEALNYRCLAYISQPLSPFHLLVGPNASGKSTFLDVLGLIRDFLTLGLDDAILTRGGRSGRASRVEELFFNQQGDRFEVAVNSPCQIHYSIKREMVNTASHDMKSPWGRQTEAMNWRSSKSSFGFVRNRKLGRRGIPLLCFPLNQRGQTAS